MLEKIKRTIYKVAIYIRLSKEDMDYFSICKYLCTTPDVMSFKLFSLIRRGYTYDLPMGIDSRFLGK